MLDPPQKLQILVLFDLVIYDLGVEGSLVFRLFYVFLDLAYLQ